VPTAEELHAGVVQAWWDAAGRYSLNLSEAADWGTGSESRRKCWACAMGGASVMILRMDIAGTPLSDLRDCGQVVRFFEMVDLNGMEPHDELARGDTRYVLARPGRRYVAYTPSYTRGIGLKNMEQGRYSFMWFDCIDGTVVRRDAVDVAGGDRNWPKPAEIGSELVVHIVRLDE
jgi:hypothetical protein